MEKTRTSIWSSIIDSIRAFANTEVNSDGKIDEGRLTSEEKRELAEIRKMDKVDTIEERANLRKKYGATVDEAKAKANVKEKQVEEKTIGSK